MLKVGNDWMNQRGGECSQIASPDSGFAFKGPDQVSVVVTRHFRSNDAREWLASFVNCAHHSVRQLSLDNGGRVLVEA